MKILHLSTFDIKGGAARAAHRLHTGLRTIDVDSRMLVRRKLSDDPEVTGSTSLFGRGMGYLRELIDSFPLRFYGNREPGVWGPGWLGSGLWKNVRALEPDVINMHWTGGGFAPPAVMKKFGKPIVWTLHDMWAFTGGCHYAGECEKYKNSCGACPLLGSNKENDLSRKGWERKKKAYESLDLTIVTPSRWLGECVKQSSLPAGFRVEVLPNGLDLERFKDLDRGAAREALDLPTDKRFILFGAVSSTSDRRKGFHLLHPALRHLSAGEGIDNIELLVFGSDEPENAPDFGLPARYLGTLNDEAKLARLYAAADVCVAPSLQDNLPNIVVEAMACGTPCAAFEIGGMPDMIDHKKNGYLARAFDAKDLAAGIEWILQNDVRQQARKTAEKKFELTLSAKKYEELYKELARSS